MRGTIGVEPPLDALVVHLARRCNIPPWQFELECDEHWWHWLLAYDAAEAEARSK